MCSEIETLLLLRMAQRVLRLFLKNLIIIFHRTEIQYLSERENRYNANLKFLAELKYLFKSFSFTLICFEILYFIKIAI